MRAFRSCDQLPLQFDAVAADFTESGREHDRERNAGGAALLDHAQHVIRRESDERHIARLRHRCNVLVAREFLDLRIFRIDRIDLAFETEFGQQLERLAADARQIVGGADHRDRARVHEA